MAHKVIWNESAVVDIEQIREYIARDSERYANRVASELFELGESLGSEYMLGRVVPEYGKEDIRERILYSYRLVYRVEASAVRVLGIIHGARRMPKGLTD